ncbi:MAG: hypothetical protein JRG89_15890 [Deltaproteobacteria bacterium]|nr:hypothetical protein [Deltaproteobacteria bacterium]
MSAHPLDANAESNNASHHDTRLARFYWASVAGIILLLWIAPAIPTQDGPSHLYNLALIDDLLGDAPSRATFYQLDFHSFTNLGFIAVGLPLAKFLPSWAVERAVLSLHVVLLALFATLWLAQSGRRVYPTAWVALAFSLPWSLFMGFYSYQLGSDLALLALCLAWKQRDRALHLLALWSFSTAAVVLVFHAVAAALLAGLFALVQLTREDIPIGNRMLRASAVAAPILVTVFIAIGGNAGDPAPSWRTLDYTVLLLASFGTLTFSSQLLTCSLVTLGWILLCLPGEQPRRRDRMARFVVASGASLALLHLALPDFVGGGGYLTGRFAWWIPLLMLPILDTGPMKWRNLSRDWMPAALAAIAIGSTAFSAAPSARLVAEVERAADEHPVSGTLATAIFDRNPKSDAMIQPLRHLGSLFVLRSGVLMTNYQARVPFFPVRFSEHALARFPDIDINSAWLTRWDRLPISALVTIDAQPADRRELEANFESSWTAENKRVELWRRRSPDDS